MERRKKFKTGKKVWSDDVRKGGEWGHGLSSAALSEAAFTAAMMAPLTPADSILARPQMVVPAGEATLFFTWVGGGEEEEESRMIIMVDNAC